MATPRCSARRLLVPSDVNKPVEECSGCDDESRAAETLPRFQFQPRNAPIIRQDAATQNMIAQGIPHGCDVCSRHRRYHLYQIASELNCTVLALGHTADDCAESLLRNVLFNGRIASLPPVIRAASGRS